MNGRPVKGLDRPPGGRTERQVAAEVIVLLMQAGVIQRAPAQLAKSSEAVGIPVDTVRQAWNTRDRNGHAPPIDGQPVADGEQLYGNRSAAAPGTDDSLEALLEVAEASKLLRVRAKAKRVREAVAELRRLLDEDRQTEEVRQEIDRLQKELRDAKAKLRGPERRYGPPPGAAGVSFRDVWEWAETQGYTRKRGRPNNILVQQYKEAHGITS
jgi:hypothetical protein